MSNVSVEAKKAEALGRMKELSIFEQIIERFDKLGKVGISTPPVGAFFCAEGEDLERVKDFEQQFNALVFVIVRSFTDVGIMDSFLFVSDYPEEWQDDRLLLKHGEAVAYVYNHSMPYCQDIGSIGIQLTSAAGLRRIW